VYRCTSGCCGSSSPCRCSFAERRPRQQPCLSRTSERQPKSRSYVRMGGPTTDYRLHVRSLRAQLCRRARSLPCRELTAVPLSRQVAHLRPLPLSLLPQTTARADRCPPLSVSDSKLQNLVSNLSKGTANSSPIGNGSTADAVRYERVTGQPVGLVGTDASFAVVLVDTCMYDAPSSSHKRI
jgi:hypothetical protein